jgi:plastocyanin
MTFPRRAIYFEEPIGPKTFTIDISGPNSIEYIVTGEDRNGSFTSQSNYAINVNAGDIINFILAANMVSHPLWIKTSPTTGTGNGVTTGTITPSNGQLAGTMAWDTSGVAAGTYYYQCQYHGGMYGTIIVS